MILSLSGGEHVELPIDGQRDQFFDDFPIQAFWAPRYSEKKRKAYALGLMSEFMSSRSN